MIKILAIGNSFSEDATRYLYEIAKKDGTSMKVVNLYIAGCSLHHHYINALEDQKSYLIMFNGYDTGFYTSIKEALMSDDWDVVTLQQASRYSGNYETYQPYLRYLAEQIHIHSPKSKIYIHQTWSYEADSEKLKGIGYATPTQMLKDIRASYSIAKGDISADGLIPSGELMAALVENGIEKVHRDTYHASKGIGRYALALLWYRIFSEKEVLHDTFHHFDEEITEKDLQIIRETVQRLTITI